MNISKEELYIALNYILESIESRNNMHAMEQIQDLINKIKLWKIYLKIQ